MMSWSLPAARTAVQTVTLRQLIDECGGKLSFGKAGEQQLQNFHTILRTAGDRGQIRHRTGPRWVWSTNDSDLVVVRQLVKAKVVQLGAAPDVTHANRGYSDARPAVFLPPQSLESRRSKETEVVEAFDSVPANAESIVPNTNTGSAPNPNSTLQKCIRKSASNDTLQKVKERAPRTRSRRQGEIRVLKRKWMEAELAEGEAELRREWEMLPRDAATQELLAWRYGDLGRQGKGDECWDRVRSALDALISQRKAEVGVMALPAADLEGEGGVDRAACASMSSARSATSLLERLGVLSAQLPHPALILLESEMSETERLEGSMQNSHVDLAALALLRRYAHLDTVERAALWSVVAHRARLQEIALLRALETHGIAAAPVSAKTPETGFELFLQSRAHQSAFTGARVEERLCKDLKPECDPLWLFQAEMEFLSLSREEKQQHLQRAEEGQMTTGMQDPSSLEPNISGVPDKASQVIANWTPVCS